MSEFLKELGEKIADKGMVLPSDRKLDRIVTLYCNKAYKNKIENEFTNESIRYIQYSNHSELGKHFSISGFKTRLVIDEHYDTPIIKAGYYDSGDN